MSPTGELIKARCASCDPAWATTLLELGHLLNPDTDCPPPADWARLIHLADATLLTPAVAEAVITKGFTLPKEEGDYLSAIRAAHQDRSVALHEQMRGLFRAFAEQGITPVLLKGAAILAFECEPGGLGRAVRDLDILLQEPELEPAARVLADLGYGFDEAEAAYLQGYRHLAGRSRDGCPAVVELHSHPIVAGVWEKFAGTEAARLMEIPYAGMVVKVPCIMGRVTQAIVGNQLQDGHLRYHRVDFRRLYDVVLMTRCWAEADWALLHKVISRAGYGRAHDAFVSQLSAIFGAGPSSLRGKAELSPILLAKFCCQRFDRAHQALVTSGVPEAAGKARVEHGAAVAAGGGLFKVWRHRKLVSTLVGPALVCFRHGIPPWHFQ